MRKNYFASLLLLAGLAHSQNAPLIDVTIPQPYAVCNLGDCTELNAVYNVGKSTTDYTVNSIAFQLLFPTVGGTVLNNSADDVWSPIVNLPFNFCFYGNTYNQLYVGSNGVVSFEVSSPQGGCPWAFTAQIPAANFPIKNAIYGVYQDNNISSPPVTNTVIQNVNYYMLDTGLNAAPNRIFVINFNELPQYQCNESVGLQTSQILLHEGTNIVDVLVKKRTACSTWNSGSGLIGLQNSAGTASTVPPGRNTGNWSANNEAWRFTPNGADIASELKWYRDGVFMGSENPISVCPTEDNHVYTASVTFDNCGNTVTVSKDYTQNLIAPPLPVLPPADIQVCADVNVVNVDQNVYILSSSPTPMDYEIYYYTNESDAINNTPNYLTNLQNFVVSTSPTTIYVRVEDVVSTGCYNIFPFNITILPPVEAPTGNAQQDFAPGQTLADLDVTGQSIVWYDQPSQGTILPSNTVLQNGVTYYASQSLDGCESRNVNSVRLAVTAHLVLANSSFERQSVKFYPNPVSGILHLAFDKTLKSVVIYNAIGQKVLAQYPDKKEVKLDVSGLQRGIYFVKISSENQQQTVKIVKE